MSVNLDKKTLIRRIAEIIISELKLEDVTLDSFESGARPGG